MADKNINMLPQVPQLDDDSLMVVEQQGAAMKMTGRQFKDFGRQSVIEEVQGYVEAAESAADSATGAVKAVTDMTVEARALEEGGDATVEKTEKDGVFNLSFGLPRGRQGEPGPEGKTGPRGAKGDPGNGLTVLGYYATPEALEAAVPDPEAGDAYGVGPEPPYDIYVFDGVTGTWRNNGPFSGGSILPEDAVTSEGGAELEIPSGFGGTPHTVTFTEEEEPPLTAEDIAYGVDGTVQEALEGLFTSVGDGKALLASAITGKGVPTAQDAAFADMAENIGKITGGADPSDATATPGDILAPKTAYTAAGKVEGIIPTLAGQVITPGTADQTIAGGQYLGGTQVIKGDANLSPANIRQGVSLFGVAGAMTSQFLATLTVTVDAGAVVTATHTNGTEVSALSANGSVTLELPIEGRWTVTARRGVAQYNSVVVDVSSSYSAALTAQVHVEYFGTITNLIKERESMASASIGNYALFGGGYYYTSSVGAKSSYLSTVDAYDKELTHSVPSELTSAKRFLTAAVAGSYALFAGGATSDGNVDTVEAYDATLTKSIPSSPLSSAKSKLASGSIGEYALFGGGSLTNSVDAYDSALTRTSPAVLVMQSYDLAAASNGSSLLFGGGGGANGWIAHVTAYDSTLTRSTPAALSAVRGELSAASAGNYVVFAGGLSTSIGSSKSVVDAYDLFLTRTTPEPLSIGRSDMGATTLNGYAIFGGGNTGGEADRYKNSSAKVDAYDPYLTRTSPKDLSHSRYNLSATTIGSFVLLAGGRTGGSSNYYVEAYKYV